MYIYGKGIFWDVEARKTIYSSIDYLYSEDIDGTT